MSGTDKFVTVNGLRLHYVEHGDPARPTMVCLHGGGGHGHAWDAFASLVSDEYRVLALTFRGHGDSDRADRYGYELLNLDTAEFIRGLGVAPAALIGHSLGGGTAWCVAALWPALVSHLVIVDASIQPNPVAWERIIESMRDRPEAFASVEDAMAYFRGNLPGMPEDELRRYIEVDVLLGDDGRYRRKYDLNMGRTGLEMSEDEAARLRRETDEANRNLLSVIQCPTLLVCGARSDILLPEVAHEMLGLLKDARYVELDTDHWVFQERPREFADAVLDFLAATA
jgi:pimeloyl-ACP methyl ester carboxylesterase